MKIKIRKISVIFLCLVMVATVFAVAVPKNVEGSARPPYEGYVTILPGGIVNYNPPPAIAPIDTSFDSLTSTWTHTLINDIKGEIYISADDIILDGNGHSVMWGYWGIYCSNCDGVTIMNVVIHACSDVGINLVYSNDNTIIGNRITVPDDWGDYTDCGIGLSGSSGNTITGNTIWTENFDLIDPSDPHGGVLWGIYLAASDGNTVTGNTAPGWDSGIYIGGSEGNTIGGNKVFGSVTGAITLVASTHNVVVGNSIPAHPRVRGYGFHLYYSSLNCIKGNTVEDQVRGIQLHSSNNNDIFHNNFINNLPQVANYGSTNRWDNGAGEGNYWSDYIGVDDGSGGRTAGDGVGDTGIPHLGVDWYPLMNPSSPDSVPKLQEMKDYIQDPDHFRDMPDGMKEGLISQLEAAERALTDSAPCAAKHILEGFLKHIDGLKKANKMSDSEYQDLWLWAMEIITPITCP